jgi:hypothetical protein
MVLNNQIQKKMILININNIFDLGKNLYLLSLLTGEQEKNKLINLFSFSINLLDNLTNTFELGSVYLNVKELSDQLKSCKELETDIIDIQTINQISQSALGLDFLLKNNFNYQTTFTPTSKGPYRLDVLLYFPENLFSLCLLKILPNTKSDLIAFGRAFAFDLPDACVFYLMRIFEVVIIRYHEVFSDKDVVANIKNIGGHIDALEKIENQDSELISILRSIKNIYRNPIIHPEVNMTMKNMIRMFGVVNAAMDLMLDIIENNSSNLKE